MRGDPPGLPSQAGDDDLLTIDEVAAWLRLSRKSVYKMPELRRYKIRIGRRAVRFRRGDLRRWLSLRTGAGEGRLPTPADRSASW